MFDLFLIFCMFKFRMKDIQNSNERSKSEFLEEVSHNSLQDG